MADEKKREDYEVELGEKANGRYSPPRPATPRFSPAPLASGSSQNIAAVLSYCASSILMTVTNKVSLGYTSRAGERVLTCEQYVLSGTDYNLNFFLLCVQVSYCA